ncbi:hypothetical protein [Jatrophihabitans lederbergiae]|uniref:Uncharacterized protein n=1 Tax=Jatrophihabitans lederbergiae TaxID=3075547 RepID=A0ABU2JHB3_9ACTN|nr:hypothetical protein [Jatrophihabitans sp. DSM 44399]MDT0264378.1 hypothetical protein [Jatrophihabitans sp. DSM 44399]
MKLMPIPAGIDPATAQQLRVGRAWWVAEAEVSRIPVSAEADAAGFETDFEYQTWQALCARRDLELFVRKRGNSQRERFDGLGEVLQTEPASPRLGVDAATVG